MPKITIEDIKVNRRRNLSSNGKKVLPSHEVFPNKNTDRKNIDNFREEQQKFPKIEKEREEVLSDKPKINESLKWRTEEKRMGRTPRIKNNPKPIRKLFLFLILFFVLLGGGYWGGNLLQKANIYITAKHEIIDYKNKQFVALKDPANNSVTFEIMITSDKRTKNITLKDSKEVSTKAEGSIILFNEFSINPVKLSTGTFLSDNEGKAYKTNSTISIPGYKTVNGKIIPGEIVVGISAFLPGESYNGAPSIFYINSLKGTTKYTKIYGKLKTPLIGGAQGLVYKISENSKADVEGLAQSYLKDDLIEKVKALVPPGYILYPGASSFSYSTNNNNIYSKTPETEIEIEGVLSVVIINEKSLMDNIIKISLKDITEEELSEIKISNLRDLSFSFVENNQLITKGMDSISFYLTGQPEAIWHPDIETIKTKLLGIHKDEVLPIFRQDKGISSAIIKIFPFWQKYIPNNISKINITVD